MAKSLKEKPHNGGQWTKARFTSFIKSQLRGGRWPPKYQCLKDAQTEKKTNVKTGRLAMHYLCNECGNDFPAKEVVADHIDPVIDPDVGFTNWDEYIERLYIEVDGFQCLCKPCHKIKTDDEKARAKIRRDNER